jgi:hypothetical protein
VPNNDDLTAEEREHQPLIQQLQKMYNTHIQDEEDLGAIRQQLSQTGLLPAASPPKGKTFHRAPGGENLGMVVHPSGFPSHHKTSWSSLLDMLAATLIVTLLTGSLVTLLLLARSHQSATTRLSDATSTGSSLVSTPCNQPYPITGTIIKVTSSTLNPPDGVILVKGPKEQFRGFLGGTFWINIGPDTRLFEQQGKSCHTVSFANIRVGQRIQASPPKDIAQSLPPILSGVDRLVLLPPEPSPGAQVPCQTQQLLLVAGQMASDLGNAGVQLSFKNRSLVNCTLVGYPTLQLLTAQQKPLQAQITGSTSGYLYSTRPPQMISLHPGQKAYFVVTWTNLGCGKIPPASYASLVSFLRVTPPLNQASLLIAVQFCAFRNQVAVSPVESSQVLFVFSGGSSGK